MQQTATTLHYAIPSNKFYPPHIDDEQALFRNTLITQKLPKKNTANKIVIIEAQAGQGKSTLAYQYITHHDIPHIWYQIGREDSDPVLLLTALLSSCMKKYPDFQSPQLDTILKEGEVGPLDITRCANILLNDLDQYLQDDLLLVFDDLHLIENATLTNSLFAHLLDTAPPRLRFILISRQPIAIKCKSLRNRANTAYFSTADLALNSYEIESLLNNIFNWSINVGEAEQIQKITNGWVMGIIMAAHPKTGKHDVSGEQRTLASFSNLVSHEDMLEYFQEEIFTHIPAKLHHPFLKLSFLDEIDSELSALITGVSNIEETLSELAKENLFIYRLDDTHRIFRFHHLYQEFLQQRAHQDLPAMEIDAIYERAATYYLEKDMKVKALTCYCLGKKFQMMDHLMQKEGLHLLAQNRTVTLLGLLRSIPDDILTQFGWLTLFSGVLAMDVTPEKTLPLFQAAKEKFIKEEEQIGELLAIAQIMYFHFVISGRYNTGAELLPRAEKLFLATKDSLPINAKIWTARNLAAGFCFFSSQMDKARGYIQIAKDLATQHNIRNFLASTRFILGYIELLSGNRKSCQQEAEISYSHLNDPLVGMSNKLTLRVMHLADLSMHGDFQNFFTQQHLLQTSIDKQIVKQTVAAPYMYVWGCSCLVSMGRTKDALDLIKQGFDISGTARAEHMQSQLLQWLAFASAISGDKEQAETSIAESLSLRAIAGGPFYQSFNHIIAGAIFTRLEDFDKAKDNLERGIEISENIPSPYLQACGLIHMSNYHFQVEQEKEGLLLLEKGLLIMHENKYSHFWSWDPIMMADLLSRAIKNDIQKDFSIQLASQRLQVNIDKKGNLFPLLQFTLLEDFSVRYKGQKLLQLDDITPFQREILGLLLVAKGNKFSQEKIQLILWPDSPPQKARKKFDTLLGRLRKSLSTHLSLPIKNYIVMQKGILSLSNIQTDVQQFIEAGERALYHTKRNELWQAGNFFNKALSLWKGNLPSNIFTSDPVFSYENNLLSHFSNISIRWAGILAQTDQLDEAILVIENLLQTNGLDENGILLLCRLHNQANQPLKVRATLKRYAQALKQIEYDDDEIEEILSDIRTSLEEQPTFSKS